MPSVFSRTMRARLPAFSGKFGIGPIIPPVVANWWAATTGGADSLNDATLISAIASMGAAGRNQTGNKGFAYVPVAANSARTVAVQHAGFGPDGGLIPFHWNNDPLSMTMTATMTATALASGGTALSPSAFRPGGDGYPSRNNWIHIPPNTPAGWVNMTATNASGNASGFEFRLHDKNAPKPLPYVVNFGDSTVESSIGDRQLEAAFKAIIPGCGIVQFGGERGSSQPNLYENEQILPLADAHPLAGFVLMPAINYSYDNPADYTESTATAQAEYTLWDRLLGLINTRWPNAMKFSALYRGQNDAVNTTDNRAQFNGTNGRSKTVRLLRYPVVNKNMPQSIDATYGDGFGSQYVWAENYQDGVLGNLNVDGNHLSTAGNARTREALFPFMAQFLRALGYTVPASYDWTFLERVLQAEEANATITSERKAVVTFLLDTRDASTPTPTSAQATARQAQRTRLNNIAVAAPPTGTLTQASGSQGSATKTFTWTRSVSGPVSFTFTKENNATGARQQATTGTTGTVSFTSGGGVGSYFNIDMFDATTGGNRIATIRVLW